MSHTIRNQTKLLARVRRLKGQMEAIERALEAEQPCGDILNLVASVRGAVQGLTVELIEDHIREHVAGPGVETDRDRQQGAAELIEVVRRYLK
ncbi:metal/formaldehyde-sensitive transcriptional repressor [Sinorhizobium numidicum]|uniref:Metal/formaldehyde-sensitive transcriptional repressor n=1 Tax=Sinorhizobium numidicum TaxID=680248 RepID=A0ABY8CVW6_9HYPH|nr:metal/formaldehyde-sensitive transcriptional repressor [Sinorhizobium numidicum]WEX76115.1 metal/formaldehyde-sensitive transcriptional repressor [Sinorhizobium numidicum]WEX82774.1 metal/formaldehyde-sensitive transcriptional repressor [Sinorhizobium numidicum]